MVVIVLVQFVPSTFCPLSPSGFLGFWAWFSYSLPVSLSLSLFLSKSLYVYVCVCMPVCHAYMSVSLSLSLSLSLLKDRIFGHLMVSIWIRLYLIHHLSLSQPLHHGYNLTLSDCSLSHSYTHCLILLMSFSVLFLLCFSPSL